MQFNQSYTRREALKTGILAGLAVPFSGFIHGTAAPAPLLSTTEAPYQHDRFPGLDANLVSKVVGASHFDLDQVDQLTKHWPELAKSSWDWGFGDTESAIGAASHVGRRDIANLLLSRGARPNVFTFVLFSQVEVVKAIVDFNPICLDTPGPHGITLLEHAEIAKNSASSDSIDHERADQLYDYLKSKTVAQDSRSTDDIDMQTKETLIGDYFYGPNPNDGFSIQLNMRKMLSLGPIGAFGGGLIHKGKLEFEYNGAPSTTVKFRKDNGVTFLNVHTPDYEIEAKKKL